MILSLATIGTVTHWHGYALALFAMRLCCLLRFFDFLKFLLV
nr:MAG TPA: hypothetical protein [Caudoviricetes sp.]